MGDQQLNETNENLVILKAYLEKLGEQANVRMFAFGYSDPEDHQTVAKDVGQAFLSGALGMAAPFLVKSADFFALPGLVVITDSDVLYVRYETVPLEGVNAESLYVTKQQLHYLLESEEEWSVKKMSLENAIANYDDHRLTIEGDFSCQIQLPVHAEIFRIAGNQTAQAIAYEINGMTELMPPKDLINRIIEGGDLPPSSEQLQMGGNSAFIEELVELVPPLRAASREKVIDALRCMHPNISDRIDELVLEKSEGALDGFPATARKLLVAGGVALGAVSARIVWISSNSENAAGSWIKSGLIEMVIWIVAAIVFVAGIANWVENREKLWYRSKRR